MVDGITRIAVEGFKSIADRQEIEIAPLTILAGANSSGKSSIMQPLLLLKQTLEAFYDPGPLKIDEPNVKFTSSDQFLSRTEDGGTRKQLIVDISTPGLDYAVIFEKEAGKGLQVIQQRMRSHVGDITLRPDMSPGELAKELRNTPLKDAGPFSVVSKRFLLDVDSATLGRLYEDMDRPSIAEALLNVIHVPALRGSRERVFRVITTGPKFPATFDHYAASVVDQWQSEDPTKLSLLSSDLRSLGIAERVEAHRLNETELEVRVNRVAGRDVGDTVSLADVGFGVSQVFPVLVALRTADMRHLVYLEEPEIHLHPRAQVALARILSDAVKDGVRVVAETHSALLLTAIQTLVAKGDLRPYLVRLHWFQRDPMTGITRVSSTGLDDNGVFTDSGWPEDFDDVILKAESAYLDAVEGRQVR